LIWVLKNNYDKALMWFKRVMKYQFEIGEQVFIIYIFLLYRVGLQSKTLSIYCHRFIRNHL